MRPCKFLLALPIGPASVAAHGSHGDDHHGLCGVSGYDNGKSKPYYSSSTDEEDMHGACPLKCSIDPKCKSYAIGKGKCKMYDEEVEHNIIRRESGPYTYHDRGCISHWATSRAIVSSKMSQDMASASARGAAMARAASAAAAATTKHDEL